MNNKLKLPHDQDGNLLDGARVEIGLIGPSWSPLLRIRVYMDHKPEDHVTVWHVRYLSTWFGNYTPPGWFLKLIGQVK
jgi:hypothetical protein